MSLAAAAALASDDLPPPPETLTRGFEGHGGLTAPAGAPVLSRAIEVPFLFEGGHIIIDASINGGPALPFMFDTGASHIMTPDAARPLRATAERTERVGGIGRKISTADVIRVDRIDIGEAVLEQQAVHVLELRNVIVDRGARPRVAGLIGSELLQRYAVTIDYRRHKLILNAPGTKPAQAAFSLPLGFAISRDGLSHPSIVAEVDGASGEFVVDTGSGGQVLLSDRFQRGHSPFADAGRVIRFISAGGIGGHAAVRMGFGKHLRLGPYDQSPPLISASDGDFNPERSQTPNTAGVIGNAIFARFVITIDVPTGRIYFEPVAQKPPPTSLSATGLILDKPDHDAFEVIDVIEGTAAARAGLRRGDRIVEVAGRAARELAISDVHTFAPTPDQAALVIRTADQRRFDLTFSRVLP